MHCTRSFESWSRFLSRNPSEQYSTGPAKWLTMNQVCFVLMIPNRLWSLCCLMILLQKPLSFPPGTLHSSSSIGNIPKGFTCSMSTASWLSGKSRGSHSMPCSLYSFSSSLKTNVLKNCWSCSFVKLMQSCSKLFTLKHSKPKMSSTPHIRSTFGW